MEHHHLPRRSQSHGTLRSSYARHGPGRALQKPLRSVNENSALLPSPGALESMLKTTTETGDLGLFSIKSVPVSNVGFPSGGRIVAGKPRQLQPPRRSIDEANRHDGRRKGGSSRDTTSEILSMYGSNSQSSVTSTLATSHDETGQRSYSMTTMGSRHLSHNKSNATLQSQSSTGPLQRPRSPFPYPTRLKRPGARPVSPAVTEAGIVDYSRMVEIDRISLRTGHGPLKSSYPHAHRRPPPLGYRSYSNLSTPSLPYYGPPPMRRAPGPQSVRTASAASIASWNAPNASFRERANSSSRTSSLTSVVNMYYRMPPALKVAQFGPLPPPPRYYDYTEEFESKEQQGPSTPVQPLAPVPTRASSAHRPLVLREGSEEQLAAVFGADLNFFDEDSQQDDSQAETEPHLLSELDPADEGLDKDKRLEQPQQTPDKDHNSPTLPTLTLGARKLTRGSDIDLLPSQLGRISVDTFRPSLDIESKEVPLFSYPNLRQRTSAQTNTPSPARQVQVHVKTPTIRSEQGVILRNDPQDDSFLNSEQGEDNEPHEEPQAPIVPVQGSNKWRSLSESVQGILKGNSNTFTDTTTPTRHNLGGGPLKAEPPKAVFKAEVGKVHSNVESKHAQGTVEEFETTPPSHLARGAGGTHTVPDNAQHKSPRKEPDTSPRLWPTDNKVKGHRRNHAALKIITKNLPPSDEDDPQLTPSCSTTPLVSPKPISPARELRVKNSIPQLMKALPPVPGKPGYVPPSPRSSTTDDDDDRFNEILRPYSFSQSGEHRSNRAQLLPVKLGNTSGLRQKPLPDIQNRLSRIRIKSKGPNTAMSTNRESRPWNSDSNYPWCNDTPDIGLTGIETGGDRPSLKQRVRVRSSRATCDETPALGTVRRHPEVHGSEVGTDLANRQAKDLFSFSIGFNSAFRQVSRKFSGESRASTKRTTASAPNTTAASSLGRNSFKTPRIVRTSASGRRHSSGHSSDKESLAEQRRGMKKHLLSLRRLLARSPHGQSHGTPTEETEFLHVKRVAGLESTFGLENIDFESKSFTTSDDITLEHQAQRRYRLGRRMKAKISKWMRGTKAAAGHKTKECHVVEAE